MSRRERRQSEQAVKNFVPKKQNRMSTIVVAILAVITVAAWVAFTLARN
ncbi:MAG: hypothetical protein WCS54_01840 [Fibrobacteraceae bacterium]